MLSGLVGLNAEDTGFSLVGISSGPTRDAVRLGSGPRGAKAASKQDVVPRAACLELVVSLSPFSIAFRTAIQPKIITLLGTDLAVDSQVVVCPIPFPPTISGKRPHVVVVREGRRSMMS